MKHIGSFLRDVWQLSRPYFRSEEKWSAWTLLISIILLNLSMVGMNVVFNFWNKLFFNALQVKNETAFWELLLTWRRTPSGYIMPGFCGVAVVYIVVAVYSTYLNQWLQIRWRRWMTTNFLDEWLADRAYYNISLTTDAAAIGTDNPDQRIAEDLRDFVTTTLSLGVDFLSNLVTLGSFVGILWVISGDLTLFGVTIPGYMVFVALLYAIVGTWLTHLVGRPLIGLRFRQQRVEADFRYALVRLRENMEGVALYGGETEEKGNLFSRFHHVIGNWWGIMTWTKWLNALTSGYGQVAVVFPFIVAAPRFFSGAIELGGLTQIADAFGRVQNSLSWFVNVYATLAQWSAIVERLSTFQRAIAVARAANANGLIVDPTADGTVRLSDLTLELPNGTKLLEDVDLSFAPGTSVVVSGRTGSGKSTLFRAIAGIWPFAKGHIERPMEKCLFMPQRPYIPLGTLRHVVTYPHPPEKFTDAEVIRALEDAGLPELTSRLDEDPNWPQVLSGGEQQRVAVARALLDRPDWLFLDEATASLDPQSEADVYRTLRERLPRTTIISIAHRPSVAALHDRRFTLQREDGRPGHLAPQVVDAAAAQ
jgi:vitamin B12/bleomycin/antimicrobial peptide transport system ATP-binding/permease protein